MDKNPKSSQWRWLYSDYNLERSNEEKPQAIWLGHEVVLLPILWGEDKMTKNEALAWLRRVCPPEFYKTLEYFLLEDLICLVYDDGKEIVDRIIHVKGTKNK